MASDEVKAAERRLKAAQDTARRKKMGPPLDITDDDLDQMATVTDADVKTAAAHARRHGSPLFNALLDAQPIEDDG